MASDSKKRIAELITHLGTYQEVKIVPVEQVFTIIVNGQCLYASNSETFVDRCGNWDYGLQFRDPHEPYGKRISPQVFQASRAIPIGRACDNPTVKIAARAAATIDGVMHTNSQCVEFGRKELEEARSGTDRWSQPVLRWIDNSKFYIRVYVHKKVYYLCHAELRAIEANALEFSEYYGQLDDSDWKHIDELSTSLAKRVKVLHDYTSPDPDAIAEGYRPVKLPVEAPQAQE